MIARKRAFETPNQHERHYASAHPAGQKGLYDKWAVETLETEDTLSWLLARRFAVIGYHPSRVTSDERPQNRMKTEKTAHDVHSVGLLNVVSATPARPSVANASHHTTLSGLATRPGEKSGLVKASMPISASAFRARVNSLLRRSMWMG